MSINLPPDQPKYQAWRHRMVAQLRERGITDTRLLAAMEKVPRHWFWSETLLDTLLYDVDKAVQIDCGQTISRPMTVARQTQLLDLKPMMDVLEVGTGSGYQTAILCEMGVRVFTVERQNELFRKTKQLLLQLHYNARCFLGDCSRGLPEMPGYKFDRILVTCGAPIIPQELMRILRIGGIMVIPVGDCDLPSDPSMVTTQHTNQRMLRIFKQGEDPSQWHIEECGEASFVPMLSGRQF